MKKVLSIMMIALMIVITIVGITACTKDEADNLVGVWISAAEDNSHYPYALKTEEYRVYVNYYAVITESEDKKSDDLVFKSYMIYQNTGKFVEHTSSKIVINPVLEETYNMATKMGNNDVVGGSYKITFVDNDTILIEDDDDTFSKYTFRRTTMTLDEFKEMYGKDTIKK